MSHKPSVPNPVANDDSTGMMGDHLLRALRRVQPGDVRIATAYLTPDGFLFLKDGLADTGSVRLLLGERPFMNRRGPRDILTQPDEVEPLIGPAESVDWYTFLEGGFPWLLLSHEERKQLIERDGKTVEEVFDLSAWSRVTQFTEFLSREGVEVRRFLGSDIGKVAEGKVLDHNSPRTRLHAKAYLFAGDSEHYSAVGSSNLTKSGLQHNAELNLATYDTALTRQLEEWFDTKWEYGKDCKEEFIRKLEECVLFGRRYTPWQVFIKSLHAAYGRFLELGLSEAVKHRLAGFQQQAVQRCITLLQRHWGVLLADSVGLGKTYEGLGILREFAERRDGTVRALVVCPAQLMDNWNEEKLKENGILGTTISMESLPQLIDLELLPQGLDRSRRERDLRNLQERYDIILVDESHNFRNPSTKRHRALMEIIRGGKPDKRVVLLTATPINNSIWDLYHQLMLITRGDDTWYAGRGPIANLRSTFQAIEKGEGGSGLLDTMLLSLVRRTRHDVRAMQAAGEPLEIGGQEMRFPEHEIPQAIGYSLQNLYGNIYRDVIDAVDNLNFAVYQLESYGVDTSGGKVTQEQVRQRNANFVGIMKTILLKRMESSVFAFGQTVNSMVEYMDLFMSWLDQGKVMTPKQAYRLRAVLGGSLPDGDEDLESLDVKAQETLRELHDAPTDGEDVRLYVAVEEDRDRLKGLGDRLRWLDEMWGEQGDPKVQAVRELLESLPPTDQHGVPTKVALFTNYKDTAEYIFRQLGGDTESPVTKLRTASNLADGRQMTMLTGQDDQNRRRAVLERFAPLATHRETEAIDDSGLQERIEPLRKESIDLLIATDVLSEGQNLQDAQYLINYDLPWNPVRMIQRAGRIDRLFSPHDKVYIYNLMPEQGLDDLLKLVSSLTRKLVAIEDAVALDASVLGEQIEAKELDKILALRSGGAKADEVYLEGERNQGIDEGLESLNYYLDIMKQMATEDVEAIPDGVYSIKEGRQTGVYIMLRMPEDLSGEVFWNFYPLGDHAHPTTSPNDVLGLIDADSEELRKDIGDRANPFKFLEEPLQAAVSQVGERYVEAVKAQAPDKFVARLRRILQRDDILQADEDVWAWFNDWVGYSLPGDTLRRRSMQDPVRAINRVKLGAPRDQMIGLLRQLRSAVEAEGLDRRLEKPESRQPTERDLELVAWELIVGKEGLPGIELPAVPVEVTD